MFVVILKSNVKHSAWETEAEAMNQKRVLIECGYRRPYIKYYEGLRGNLKNGHYFV